MNTPLYDTLETLCGTKPLRMHMPGHKGILPRPDWQAVAQIDYTELPPTGNLYEPGGAIGAAQDLWAQAWGMSACQFITGGATQGIYSMLHLTCSPGSVLLTDRNCHRAVYNAMALLDLHPVYLWEKTPKGVEDALKAHPEAKTVCITSPDYYGRLYDVEQIAAVCHIHGAKLVVDGAHGAHIPFLQKNPYRQADLAVCSAHKTLPALGQSAVLVSGGSFGADALRRACAVYGTSSPSYPILASLDLARDYMQGEGRRRYLAVAEQVASLRRQFPALRNEPLDPGRFTLRVKNAVQVQEQLHGLNIWPEMADSGHVVFILTCSDDEQSTKRLCSALSELNLEEDTQEVSLPPEPVLQCSLRQALFSPSQQQPLKLCEGRTAACQIAPYPPGIPVIAPGEQIGKKHLAYLQKIGYNMEESVQVLT